MGKVLLLLVLIGIGLVWLRGRNRAAAAPRMPAGEARRLLGLDEAAGADDIRAAHRRLIARVHPDAGGSADLAERVNAARDTLLAEMNRRTPRAS